MPPHAIPPAPVIPTKSLGIVRWRGSAGAVNYSVERSSPDGKWELVCDKCAIDSDMGWPDLSPKGLMGAKYRITAYNADGKASESSAER